MIKVYVSRILLLIIFFLAVETYPAQEVKTVYIPGDLPYIEGKHFQQGTNVDPQGRSLDLNNHFLRLNGKSFLPVMGEIHYSRYPKNEWEEAILKMKASGIQVIGFYCFWLHHEEEEGRIRFDENRDVRHFIELCAKHDLWAFPRLGPWCHGECRHGGFPDWFAKERNSPWDRGYDDEILPEVKRWYRALSKQFEGLYFKDGGPIIGIQVDNEVRSTDADHWGYHYMSDLRHYAVEIGIDVPIYTVTGWPGPVVPEDLVVGLFGGYPAAPWTRNSDPIDPPKSFLFTPERRDRTIGSDWGFDEIEMSSTPIYRHPLLTVEMGGGNQISYHRRPVLQGKDMISLVYTRLGVGANMIGYYVYHGTQHPLSWRKEFTTQEARTTHHAYPNDYPIISYDFMAPLTEWGMIRDYYHDFKLIHHFVHDFGENLAPMYPIIPEDNPVKPTDTDSLRYAVRSRSGRGYVFFNNYVRHLEMKNHPNVQFNIQLEDENLTIPDKSLSIQNEVYGILPFNMNLNGVLLKYATAHPFIRLDHPRKIYGFYAIDSMNPEFKFDKTTVKSIDVQKGDVVSSDAFIYVRNLEPDLDCQITLNSFNGEETTLLLFQENQARHTYKFDINDKQTLLITENMAFYNAQSKTLEIRSPGESEFDFHIYPDLPSKSENISMGKKTGLFRNCLVRLSKKEMPRISFKEISNRDQYEAYCKSLDGKTPTGPTYTHRLEIDAPYLRYQLDLPDALPEGVNDVLLQFQYHGNTAQIYADDLIIADDYYSGQPMSFALRRHQDKLGKSTFVFQVTPLLPESEIYFEDGTPLDFTLKDPAGLDGIQVIPEYRIQTGLKIE